ncbi:MAG: hypothetical protein NVSMB4_01080 [Acidimicrobiales bacterium]
MADIETRAEVPRTSVVVGLPPVDASDEEISPIGHVRGTPGAFRVLRRRSERFGPLLCKQGVVGSIPIVSTDREARVTNSVKQ